MRVKRVFLDANVLFSMAYSGPDRSRSYILVDLAKSSSINILVSPLVVEEARRNLLIKKPRAVKTLEQILKSCILAEDIHLGKVPIPVSLPEDDVRVVNSALGNDAEYFLTGNTKDFKDLLGKKVGNMWILKPGDFLKEPERYE